MKTMTDENVNLVIMSYLKEELEKLQNTMPTESPEEIEIGMNFHGDVFVVLPWQTFYISQPLDNVILVKNQAFDPEIEGVDTPEIEELATIAMFDDDDDETVLANEIVRLMRSIY